MRHRFVLDYFVVKELQLRVLARSGEWARSIQKGEGKGGTI